MGLGTIHQHRGQSGNLNYSRGLRELQDKAPTTFTGGFDRLVNTLFQHPLRQLEYQMVNGLLRADASEIEADPLGHREVRGKSSAYLNGGVGIAVFDPFSNQELKDLADVPWIRRNGPPEILNLVGELVSMAPRHVVEALEESLAPTTVPELDKVKVLNPGGYACQHLMLGNDVNSIQLALHDLFTQKLAEFWVVFC